MPMTKHELLDCLSIMMKEDQTNNFAGKSLREIRTKIREVIAKSK